MTIEDAKEAHQDRLMSLPNVVGVGIGERKGKKVIKVFVSRKLSALELRPEEIVPKKLDEWDTDVEEMGFVQAQAKGQ